MQHEPGQQRGLARPRLRSPPQIPTGRGRVRAELPQLGQLLFTAQQVQGSELADLLVVARPDRGTGDQIDVTVEHSDLHNLPEHVPGDRVIAPECSRGVLRSLVVAGPFRSHYLGPFSCAPPTDDTPIHRHPDRAPHGTVGASDGSWASRRIAVKSRHKPIDSRIVKGQFGLPTGGWRAGDTWPHFGHRK